MRQHQDAALGTHTGVALRLQGLCKVWFPSAVRQNAFPVLLCSGSCRLCVDLSAVVKRGAERRCIKVSRLRMSTFFSSIVELMHVSCVATCEL